MQDLTIDFQAPSILEASTLFQWVRNKNQQLSLLWFNQKSITIECRVLWVSIVCQAPSTSARTTSKTMRMKTMTVTRLLNTLIREAVSIVSSSVSCTVRCMCHKKVKCQSVTEWQPTSSHSKRISEIGSVQWSQIYPKASWQQIR